MSRSTFRVLFYPKEEHAEKVDVFVLDVATEIKIKRPPTSHVQKKQGGRFRCYKALLSILRIITPFSQQHKYRQSEAV